MAKAPGYARRWEIDMPILVRAMVKADDVIFAAGPPDIVPDDDPYAAFDGRA